MPAELDEARTKRREIRRLDRRLGLKALALERLDALGRGYDGISRQCIAAARDGDVDYVRFCLDARVDADTKDKFGVTPLIAASSSNRLGTVQLLLERKADPRCQDINGATCCHYAVHLSHFHVLHAMLQHRGNFDSFTVKDSRQKSALDYARKADKKQVMQLLKHEMGGSCPVLWQVFKGCTWDCVGISRQNHKVPVDHKGRVVKGGCCS